MVHYVDDEANPSSETMLRSMLNMIELCRITANRLKAQDESCCGEILDGLAIAEINVRRLLADLHDEDVTQLDRIPPPDEEPT